MPSRPLARLVLVALGCLGSVHSAAAQERGAPGADATPPPDDGQLDAAIETALVLLLKNQELYEPDPPVGVLPDKQLEAWQAGERERLEEVRTRDTGREWPYEGVYRVGPDGRIPPGYRVGGTAICCQALTLAPGFAESSERRAAVARGIGFMLDLLENDERLAPGPKQGYDVRGWGHAYALEFFLHALDLELVDGPRRERVETMVPHLIRCLEVNAIETGGWNYASDTCSPFMTGSTLIALFHARARGFEFDAGMVETALDALERSRDGSTGAFAYSGAGQDPMAASAARAAIAELVLLKAGRSDPDRLRVAVEGFFENWEQLLDRKSKQGTHKGPYNIAPYYFFYGHTYAGLAIEALPETERGAWRARLRDVLWRTREGAGGWNDRVFPRTESYSTAMAVLALVAPVTPGVAEWKQDE